MVLASGLRLCCWGGGEGSMGLVAGVVVKVAGFDLWVWVRVVQVNG